MECESIAFPLLASGNNGFDRKLAFEIAKESIEKHEGKFLKNVLLIVFGDNMECMVRSQGYHVENIAEAPHKVPFVKEMIDKGLNNAFEWLKDKEHQKKIVNLGIEIALLVNPTDKTKKVLNIAKRLMK